MAMATFPPSAFRGPGISSTYNRYAFSFIAAGTRIPARRIRSSFFVKIMIFGKKRRSSVSAYRAFPPASWGHSKACSWTRSGPAPARTCGSSERLGREGQGPGVRTGSGVFGEEKPVAELHRDGSPGMRHRDKAGAGSDLDLPLHPPDERLPKASVQPLQHQEGPPRVVRPDLDPGGRGCVHVPPRNVFLRYRYVRRLPKHLERGAGSYLRRHLDLRASGPRAGLGGGSGVCACPNRPRPRPGHGGTN